MTKTESGVTPWEDRESLYENTLLSQVERMEAEIAELRARLAAPTSVSAEQPAIGKLLNDFSTLPVLWGLNEPGALMRHSDVFKMLVNAGKTYLAATTQASTAQAEARAEGWAEGIEAAAREMETWRIDIVPSTAAADIRALKRSAGDTGSGE